MLYYRLVPSLHRMAKIVMSVSCRVVALSLAAVILAPFCTRAWKMNGCPVPLSHATKNKRQFLSTKLNPDAKARGLQSIQSPNHCQLKPENSL